MPDRPSERGKCSPLSPGRATEHIRAKVKDEHLWLDIKKHAMQQMGDRDIFMGDLLYVLKNGFVHDQGHPSTQEGLYKYTIISASPNSERRLVKVVAIPHPTPRLQIITVMWADESLAGG